MSAQNDCLTLFDRLHIASCAARRAEMNVLNTDRFKGEYLTARTWSRYRCYISKECTFVDYD
jgi:hypothetical protein